MLPMNKPIGSLSASDIMSTEVVMISDQMSLQGAARLLSRSQVSGAPVVDTEGRCTGMLSAVDFLHWAEKGGKAIAQPCDGGDTAWKPWQMLDHPEHAETMVTEVMTHNPVTAPPQAPLSEISRMMLDAHIHRVLIVDAAGKPVGIVSSTDILAAVARSEALRESALKQTPELVAH
ncbi:MAG: CBS domain-containing protein [Planctomycetota bacterium]|jgi:CBS domain-containing protein